MSKQPPSLEWQIVQDDTEWVLLSGQPLSGNEGRATAATHGRHWAKWSLYITATLLFLLVSESQDWSSASPELQWSQKETHPMVKRETGTVGQRDTLTARLDEVPSAGQMASWQAVATYQAIQEHQPFAVRQTAADWQLHFAHAQSSLRAAIQASLPAGHPAGVLPMIEYWGEQTAWAGDQISADWNWQRQFVPEHSGTQNGPDDLVDVAFQTFGDGSDRAIARIVTRAGNGLPAYRQTRFYQRTAAGWQQTAPDAALWGPERSLETPSFTFRFRQRDAAAVIAVAPWVEELETILRRNYGLVVRPDAPKLVIEVRVTQPPGYARSWFQVSNPIIVPSPAVYRAPVELSDADLLAQSLALPLLVQASARAGKQHEISAVWRPLLSGLELWQLWDLNLPLAVWRGEIVTWIYLDLPATSPRQAVVLPANYAALCAAHSIWLLSPAYMNIPLQCGKLDQENGSFAPQGPREPLTRLGQLVAPETPDAYLRVPRYIHWISHPGQTVAVATIIEYAVAAHGREPLSVLLAGLGHYESWETLLPAVYGVSAAEFEAGWQAYLATQYGVEIVH